ncbi:hypothetical protein OHT76_43420 [Streptomyces sp. NBC_00287]|uniref:hypothetical protein n=1 Tax=Streptomyces sp. NBC_00287 TaxID=2975702 RepID=UPI002E28C36E|nr:hypothetical protein [Streptomyces sp. NBC_00287]
MPVPHTVVAALTGAAVLIAQALHRRLNPEPTCVTCGNRSGHRVAGHDDRTCRDFVQEQRRRVQAAATAAGNPPPTLPDTYGHAWPTSS